MRRILIWLTLSVLLIASQAVEAQASPETWPITEQCVGKASQPPADWHFDGTLLLHGQSRGWLHGYQQSWATPHIFAADSSDDAQLSPDGHWYATIKTKVEESEFVTAVFTQYISVYSTQNQSKYTVPWENFYTVIHQRYGHQLYWLDNQHLLYSKGDRDEMWYVINPFTQEIAEWQPKFDVYDKRIIFSPNHLYALAYDDVNIILSDGENRIKFPIMSIISWSPDSSHFAADTLSDTNVIDNLAIFDLQGQQIETVFHFPANPYGLLNPSKTWSPDGRYLLFAADHLYIADMIEETVIDTCVRINNLSVAWSPSSNQFAMVSPDDSKRQVQIFDLDAWARYIVTYHSGSVIGWSADD